MNDETKLRNAATGAPAPASSRISICQCDEMNFLDVERRESRRSAEADRLFAGAGRRESESVMTRVQMPSLADETEKFEHGETEKE